MSVRVRRNGYRGEPTKEPGYIGLLPKQRLCLAVVQEGPPVKRCVQPRRHKGGCKP